MIQAEGDADVGNVKAAIAMSSFKATALTGKDTDLLVLLLHDTTNNNSKNMYFRRIK